jgi:hypothetical protein
MDPLNCDSPAVLNYLGVLQSVISRMASNSANCKTWCVTVVTGTIALVAGKDKPYYIWIAAFPTVLFLFLDAYYLGLERCFRRIYNQFVNNLHDGAALSSYLFIIAPYKTTHELLQYTFEAGRSLAIWPFYILMIILLVIVRCLMGH